MTYGVLTSYERRLDGAAWLIETAVDVDRAGEALAVLSDGRRRLLLEPVSEAELDAAKAQYRERVAMRVETLWGVTNLLAKAFALQVSIDELLAVDTHLQTITPERIQQLAWHYLRRPPEIAVAGPPQEIYDSLREADVGDLIAIFDDGRGRRLPR